MGNILTQKRNGGGASPTALDELTYNYHTTTDGLVSNRLYQVNDVVSAGNYTDDIDDQGTFNNTHSTIETANNYGYDELGNLVRDVQEEIASIEWTVYGKMKKITRNSSSSKADLEFGYDASGNRLWKKVTPKGSGAVISTYYYLRDAQGNEMCRYVKYTNTTSQLMYVAEEHSIYGSSRVGVDNRKDTLYKAGSYSPAWGGANTSRRALGLKSFELANHLGNVLVTVSDKPIYKVSSTTIHFNPEITSISDYYPFGAPINGRSYSSTEYRFGYNTQEKTDEIKGSGNSYDYDARIYDTRLGRFLSPDPLAKNYLPIAPYVFTMNNPIMFLDGDGRVIKDANGNTIVVSADAKGNAAFTVIDKKGNVVEGGQPDAFTREVLTAVFVTETGKSIITKMENSADHFMYQEGNSTEEGPANNVTTEKKGIVSHKMTINTNPSKLKGRFEGISREEYINATGVHEPDHILNPDQRVLDATQSNAEEDPNSEYNKSDRNPAFQFNNFETAVLKTELQTRKEFNKEKGTTLNPASEKKYNDVIGSPKSKDVQEYKPK
jgi:RHS repeat-associated protein